MPCTTELRCFPADKDFAEKVSVQWKIKWKKKNQLPAACVTFTQFVMISGEYKKKSYFTLFLL